MRNPKKEFSGLDSPSARLTGGTNGIESPMVMIERVLKTKIGAGRDWSRGILAVRRR